MWATAITKSARCGRRWRKEPDNLEVRLALAKRYESLGSPELALEHYRLAAPAFRIRRQSTCCWQRPCAAPGPAAKGRTMLETFLAGASPDRPRIMPPSSEFCSTSRSSGPTASGATGRRWRLSPKSDSLHNNLGYNLLMQGKNDAAAANSTKP